jgi:cytochrome c-type biogenesis protein CcmH
MRRWWPFLALVLVVMGALAVVAARSAPSDAPEARASRLARELACPVCTGESVAASSSPEARAMRADIADRIAAGESDQQIRAAYVDAYGERVVLRPEGEGLGLLAWGLPVVVLVAGAALVVIAVWRWSREPRLAATADDEALVARARGEGQG